MVIQVHNIGHADARMLDNMWFFSGLHFATEGLQTIDAQRTDQCLEFRVRPTVEHPVLMILAAD